MAPTQTLTNSFMGSSCPLQAHPEPSHRGALRLATSDHEKGEALVWSITPAPQAPGKYHISATTSDGQPKRLDLYNDNSGNKIRVCLADPGHYSGQHWTLIPCDVEHTRGGGERKWYKLSNDWTGPGWFLDTYSGTYEAFMSQGEYSGQRWWITVPIEPVTTCDGFNASGTYDVEASAPGSEGSGERRAEAFRLAGAAGAGFVAGRVWEKFS